MPSEILISQAQIQVRIAELASEIRRDHPGGTPIHFVAVLKGAFMFLADLMRQMTGHVTCDFIAVSSYGGGTHSSGEVRLLKDLDHGLEGRDVVIIEDIVDTGLTLSYLQDILRAREPRSLRTACLLSKPSRRDGGREGGLRRLHDCGSVRGGLRSGRGRAVPASARHSRHRRSSVVAVLKFALISEAEARVTRAGLDRGTRARRPRDAAGVGHAAGAPGDGGAGRNGGRDAAGGPGARGADCAHCDRCRSHRPEAEGRR